MAEYKTFIPEAWTEFTNKCKSFFPFLKKTFIGTREEWNNLTLAEKKNYDACDLTDDTAGGEMVISDEVTDGDLNPVTSNAVYDSLHKTQDGSYGKSGQLGTSTTSIDIPNLPGNSIVFVYDNNSASRYWIGRYWRSSSASNHATISNSGLEIASSTTSGLTFTGSTGNLAYKILA